jgi:hypothetical protein
METKTHTDAKMDRREENIRYIADMRLDCCPADR